MNLAYKRLRSGKNIESASAAKISSINKNKISAIIKMQNASLIKLSEQNAEISDEIREYGYGILHSSYEMDEYFSAVSGKYELDKTEIELSSFLKRFCDVAKPYVVKKGIGVLHNIKDESIAVEVDTAKLLYHLSSIVQNAIENSPKGTRIRISLSSTKRFAKITIGDKGYGMSEETKLHCCEPFFTKCRIKAQKQGLGLTLAHHFVTESGGRFSIDSEKGKGTKVSFLLPLSERKEAAVSAKIKEDEIFSKNEHIIKIAFAEILSE